VRRNETIASIPYAAARMKSAGMNHETCQRKTHSRSSARLPSHPIFSSNVTSNG
jgi:hypothetical protein